VGFGIGPGQKPFHCLAIKPGDPKQQEDADLFLSTFDCRDMTLCDTNILAPGNDVRPGDSPERFNVGEAGDVKNSATSTL
jgi:hypothetical protein